MIVSRKNREFINPYLFNKNDFEQAVKALQSGGIVIHPTETVYGLAAVWNDESAIRRVARLKKRSFKKPFSILVNGIEQILHISGWRATKVGDLLDGIFPSPLTLLLPRRIQLSPGFWNQFPDIGFRFPDFKLCTTLVELVGEPLITTSANVANQQPPKTADEVDQSMIGSVDVFLNGGDCRFQIPSTVIRFNPDRPEVEVIRDGAFPPKEFFQCISDIYG